MGLSQINEDEETITALDYLEKQSQLEREARELMPYDPDTCSYTLGALRQQVFACLTCYSNTGTLNGICYACSIQCHTKHELVELFTKRSFTCDCGTTRMKTNGCCKLRSKVPRAPNQLLKRSSFDSSDGISLSSSSSSQASTDPIEGDDIPSSSNTYNDNFKGLFCDCRQVYNPMDDSNMFQCIFGDVCGEDWYHEECIMGLRPGVINRKPNKDGTSKKFETDDGNKLESLTEPGLDAETENQFKKDDEEDGSDDEEILPLPGFPDLDAFETIICWKCVEKHKPEMMNLLEELKCETVKYLRADTIESRALKLNPIKDEEDAQPTKKQKVDYPITIFLKEDFKDQLTKIVEENKPSNTKLTTLLRKHAYIYQEDPVYKPSEDSDDENSSIFEMGLKNLSKLPVDDAINGVKAYEQIKSKLTEFLKPFAEKNKIVTEDEIRGFFKKQME